MAFAGTMGFGVMEPWGLEWETVGSGAGNRGVCGHKPWGLWRQEVRVKNMLKVVLCIHDTLAKAGNNCVQKFLAQLILI